MKKTTALIMIAPCLLTAWGTVRVVDVLRPTSRDIIKTNDDPRIERLERASKAMIPLMVPMSRAMREGRWEDALREIDRVEPKVKAAGLRGLRNQRAEALVNLNRPEEVLALYSEPVHGRMAVETSPALDLAKAMLGQLDRTKLQAILSEIISRESSGKDVVAPHVDVNDAVLIVRLYRASEECGRDNEAAIREARAALAIAPRDPISSYLLAQSLDYKRRSREATPYWKVARAAPGSMGERAKERYYAVYPKENPHPKLPRVIAVRHGNQAEVDAAKKKLEWDDSWEPHFNPPNPPTGN